MNIQKTLEQLADSQKDFINYVDSSLKKVENFKDEGLTAYITGGEEELAYYYIVGYDSKTKTLSLDAGGYETFTRKLDELDFYEMLLLANECKYIVGKDKPYHKEEWEEDDLMLLPNKDNTISFYHLGTDHKVRVKGNAFNTKKEAQKWYKQNYYAIIKWLDND